MYSTAKLQGKQHTCFTNEKLMRVTREQTQHALVQVCIPLHLDW